MCYEALTWVCISFVIALRPSGLPFLLERTAAPPPTPTLTPTPPTDQLSLGRIATYFSIRRARVSALFASWTRYRIE